MPLSTLSSLDDTHVVEFGADQEYGTEWGLWEAVEFGLKGGEGVLGTAGHSMLRVRVTGSLVSGKNTAISKPNAGPCGADLQLWGNFLPICQELTTKALTHKLDLVLDTGTLHLVGWVVAFSAPRSAPKGIAEIPITFDFLIQSEDHSELS